MEFSISALLNSFTDDKLVAPKVLEKKLNCEESQTLQHLQIALDVLERIGILVKERGKYRRLSDEGLIEGKLRCSSKGFCFAIQDLDDTEDIYIRESQLNNAWNGDLVLVKVTKEGRRRRSPEGEVRLILERAHPSVIARVQQTEAGTFQAVPLDDRLLFVLALNPENHELDLKDAVDQLVHVEILQYPLGQLPPSGRITQMLGSDAQSAADTELVYCKYDLPRAFPEAVEQAAADLPRKLRKADQKKRLALQDKLTLTICEPTIGDTGLDHAFSLEQTTDGNWSVIIHVSDLAHYVPLNSPLTEESERRGCTMCLGDKILPLYPDLFLERIGALLPDVERLTMSVIISLNAQGEVLEFEVQPSVTQVDYQLTPSEAQAVIERDQGDAEAVAKWSPIFNTLDLLQQVSQCLVLQRQQRGSFVLPLSELPPQISGDETSLGVVASQTPGHVQAMVAELMVLANQLVVGHLQALGVPAVYRLQSPPDAPDVQDLMRLAANVSLPITLGQEDIVQPQDFLAFVEKFQGAEPAPVLFELLKATLKPVTYSDVSGPHFGLAQVQNYGQFTSPLNRHGDFLNQFVLQAVFNQGRDRRTTRAKERVKLQHSSCQGQVSWNVLPPELQRELESAVANAVPSLNEREQLSRQAEQDLVGLQKTKQMQAHTGKRLQGIITGIQSYGFFVRIDTLMVEGLVHVSSLKDDWYEYRSRQQTLIGRKNRRQYQLGDRVEVEVKSVDYYRQQIDLVVVGGGSQASEEDVADTTPPELPKIKTSPATVATQTTDDEAELENTGEE